MADSSQSNSQTVGRGILWITAAKIHFTLAGVLLLTLLPRLIAEGQEDRARLYGTFSIVIGLLNPLTMMMITGTLQAVSKNVSEAPSRLAGARKTALVMQIVIGAVFTAVFYLASPIVAQWMGDDALVVPLKISSVIIGCYAVYAAMIGCLNGVKKFRSQALLDIAFATIKTILILLFAAIGWKVSGAVGGFSLTAVIMTLVAVVVVFSVHAEAGDNRQKVDWWQILRYQGWIMLFALSANLLMNVDLYIVKSMSEDAVSVGIYSICLQIARLPYIAVVSVTFVIFPLVSRASYDEDTDAVSEYITRTLRYTLLLVGTLALCLAATAEDVLRLVFDPIFISGWPILIGLSLAYLSYAMLIICTTIITSSGSPITSLALVVLTLAIAVGVGTVAMDNFGPNGLAAGMAMSIATGFLITIAYLRHRFHVLLPIYSFLRLSVAGTLSIVIGRHWIPEVPVAIIFKGIIIGLLFLMVLFVMKEFSKSDLEVILAAIRSKQRPR